MKILFLQARFYPQIGGVEKHTYEIAKCLIKKGHTVSILTEKLASSKKKKYHSKVSSDNQINKVKSPYLDSFFESKTLDKIITYYFKFGQNGSLKKFKIWYQLWKMRHLIADADIIHCHDVFIWYFPFRFLYPRKAVYTTFHGYESYPIRWQAKIVRKISERLSWGNICIGEFIKKWYGTVPTYISYGGTEIPNNSKSQNSNDKKRSAVFIGRLDDQTGIKEYIEAIKLIRKYYPKFHFSIIGDGKYKEDAKKVGKWQGFTKDIMIYLYQDQFAFLSRYLGMLEAMIAKRLVIAVYDNPIKEDYLKMSPFSKYVVVANSPQEIAEKVIFYMKYPRKKKQRIDASYVWAKKQTWENVTKLYLKLWKIL